jgi:hypothetical protein
MENGWYPLRVVLLTTLLQRFVFSRLDVSYACVYVGVCV